MKTRMMALGALAVIVAGGATAGEPRGIQTTQLADSFEVYVPCLGEIVSTNILVDVRYHVFETTSGSVHVVDNWRLYYLLTAESGREWLGEGVSPYQLNAKVDKGVVEQWISRIRLVPITDGTPKILYQNQFKITVNAAGELVAIHETDPLGDSFQCLPSAK